MFKTQKYTVSGCFASGQYATAALKKKHEWKSKSVTSPLLAPFVTTFTLALDFLVFLAVRFLSSLTGESLLEGELLLGDSTMTAGLAASAVTVDLDIEMELIEIEINWLTQFLKGILLK